MSLTKHLFFTSIFVIINVLFSNAEVGISNTDLNDLSEKQNAIKINKCCEPNELMVDSRCRLATLTNAKLWKPEFTSDDGKDKVTVKYFKTIYGIPDCDTTQQRAIFHTSEGEDRLALLTDGRLRHYIYHEHPKSMEVLQFERYGGLHEPLPYFENEPEPSFYDHVQGKYCLEMNLNSKKNESTLYALVCVPEVKINWSDSDFIMKRVLNPLFHALAMTIYLVVAIIYFVLPTLRDLAGNIITTINVCLIVSQAADLVRTFTEFSHHVSFMVADIVLYVSLLAAFFWLNSFGFYLWKMFKSRNVFLRVTDVRKYCYYGCFAWGCTALMTALAIFGHFTLDSNTRRRNPHFSTSIIADEDQETIGWLGIAIFFTPVAFTIILNVFFYVTTRKVLQRATSYGRIHFKLKRSFDLFLHMFLIMTFSWLFLLMSWIHIDGLVYAHVVVNLMQALLMLYVCVLRQSHVTYLLRKSCWYAEPVGATEWGDEMQHMNGGHY